jgi:hypothetical protein
MGGDDPLDALASLKKYTDATWFGKSGMLLREYFMNSILSNPGSWVLNGGSGLAMGGILPIERALGGKLAALATKNSSKFQAVVARETAVMQKFFSGLGEAIEIMRKTGGVGYVAGGKFEDFSTFSNIRHATKGKGEIVEYLGKAMTFPSWVMGQEDAVVKIAAYRGNARIALGEMAAKAGVPENVRTEWVEGQLSIMTENRARLAESAAIDNILPDVIADAPPDIAEALSKRIDLESAQIKELLRIHEDSIKFGEDLTFSNRKGTGIFQKTGAYVSTWISDYPAFGFMIPFVRTPANIAQFTWDRSFGLGLEAGALAWNRTAAKFKLPALDTEGMLGGLSRELSNPDPRIQAYAVGRLATGTMFATAVALATVNTDDDGSGLPRVTGAGPADPEERRALEAAGWQPYSIRVNGRYVQYSRLDPFASFIGMIADFTETKQQIASDPTKDADSLGAVATGIVASLAKNLTSKTYLQGLTNLLEAMTGDSRKVESALGAVAGAFVPSIVAGQVGAADNEMREIRSILDRVRSRIPGVSTTLAPRRNMLGEKVKRNSSTGLTAVDAFLPARIQAVSDDVIAQEVAALGFGFNVPGLVTSGVDLTDEAFVVNGQDAYDRYSELSGQVKIGGKDLRQAVRALIANPSYQAIPPEIDDFGNPSGRVALINSLLSKYRRKAWTELTRERPQIAAQARKVAEARRRPSILS